MNVYTNLVTIFFIIGSGIPSSATAAGAPSALNTLSNPMVAMAGGGSMNTFDEMLKVTPPGLVAFLANLPAVEGSQSATAISKNNKTNFKNHRCISSINVLAMHQETG